jgi:hypothetical protein
MVLKLPLSALPLSRRVSVRNVNANDIPSTTAEVFTSSNIDAGRRGDRHGSISCVGCICGDSDESDDGEGVGANISLDGCSRGVSSWSLGLGG